MFFKILKHSFWSLISIDFDDIVGFGVEFEYHWGSLLVKDIDSFPNSLRIVVSSPTAFGPTDKPLLHHPFWAFEINDMTKLETGSHDLLPFANVLLVSGKTIQQKYVVFAIIAELLFGQVYDDFAGDQFALLHVLPDCLCMQAIVFLLLP